MKHINAFVFAQSLLELNRHIRISKRIFYLNGSITMCSQRNITLYSVGQRSHFII